MSDNFGEVLPHVFFGDLTRHVEWRFADVEVGSPASRKAEQGLRRLLQDLEDAYFAGDEERTELILVSFLEHLPRPEEQGSGVRNWLGPELTAQLRVIV